MNKTVTVPLSEYLELRDFKEGISSGNTCMVKVTDFYPF